MRGIFILAAACGILAAQTPVKTRLNNLKQLTNGGQNAEAYWSPDGKKLVFQSTREPHACDQIYVMNADGSDLHLVSTGKGVTTCGYFLSDNQNVVFASTHEAGDACPARPDRSKGYVWAVYAGFDIYRGSEKGGALTKLTNTPGYDAEATVNWKNKKILYTSMASGDLDLWTMNEDGSNKKQITKSTGYDGGAVFDRSGKNMVWRANHPNGDDPMKRYKALLSENLTTPMKMEVFVSDAKGMKPKQITNVGCAAFAPTYSPDGKKIVFASNQHNCDGRKFELFMMNADGSGIEQITNFGGFTSFPEFSPDGKKLVFASDKDAKGRYEFNIFVADWVN